MTYTFEICANSAESCLAAQEGGAHRVELCAAMPEGGTTPSFGEIKLARKLIDIRLHVIIRPRGGDFLYSPLELDMPAMTRLMKASEGMAVTFHRAFDYVKDPKKVMETLIEMGVDRILTSGQQPSAIKGANLLAELVKQADGRIIIMPGCGVNESNIAELAKITGASEFHFSARENRESRMQLRNPALSMGGPVVIDEYINPVTTANRVRNTIKSLTDHV